MIPSETMRRWQTVHQKEKSLMPSETMRQGQTVHQTEKSLMPSETMRRGQMAKCTIKNTDFTKAFDTVCKTFYSGNTGPTNKPKFISF